MFLRNPIEKYHIHLFLAEVTRGGWQAKGFADVFLSVRLSLHIAPVLWNQESTGLDKNIGTLDTVHSVHTRSVRLIIL